eukprot:1160256-Pelagomonas_calceolata.AAC.4
MASSRAQRCGGRGKSMAAIRPHMSFGGGEIEGCDVIGGFKQDTEVWWAWEIDGCNVIQGCKQAKNVWVGEDAYGRKEGGPIGGGKDMLVGREQHCARSSARPALPLCNTVQHCVRLCATLCNIVQGLLSSLPCIFAHCARFSEQPALPLSSDKKEELGYYTAHGFHPFLHSIDIP